MNQFRPALESLETRDTPATFFVDARGTLVVTGTNGDDVIEVTQVGGDFFVDGVQVVGTVNKIRVAALDGNDSVTIGSNITKRAELFGNNGNDTLTGAGGQDALYGGDGHDELYGGDANDYLSGGLGVDLMNGGAGFDSAFDDGDNPTYIDIEQIQ